ncbi:hypothetical protein GCM10011412_11160 [Maribacter cobaltidurans]|nr:hypothetical protein GCM10011412_11160 [Maribacter cobaltidurans]
MLICSYLALKFEDHKPWIKEGFNRFICILRLQTERFAVVSFNILRTLTYRLVQLLGLQKN